MSDQRPTTKSEFHISIPDELSAVLGPELEVRLVRKMTDAGLEMLREMGFEVGKSEIEKVE